MKGRYLSKAIFFGVTDLGGMGLLVGLGFEPGKQKTSWRHCRRRLGERRKALAAT
jgi:hypothetical protein